MDSTHDPHMGAASTEAIVECRPDVGLRRPAVLLEEMSGRHDDARDAVAALGGLLVQECLLQGMEAVGCSEPFQCDDLTPGDVAHGQLARPYGLTVDVDSAGAAAGQAAAKSNRVEVQLISQDVEERGVGGRCNG